MPIMNSIETTEEIFKHFSSENIPTIIAVTAHSEEEGYSICKTSGMKGYLTKPIKPDNLRNILKKYLSFSF